jgi:hypothetical protein
MKKISLGSRKQGGVSKIEEVGGEVPTRTQLSVMLTASGSAGVGVSVAAAAPAGWEEAE